MYFTCYQSPIGQLTIASDGNSITGLWMNDQKFFRSTLSDDAVEDPFLPVFAETTLWLDRYFQGDIKSTATIPLKPCGTPYQQSVWSALLEIPYGKTCTYGEIAERISRLTGRKTSPRTVGHAIGRNPISILIPCHRVVGQNQALTGYAGGLHRKEFLLQLERNATQH